MLMCSIIDGAKYALWCLILYMNIIVFFDIMFSEILLNHLEALSIWLMKDDCLIIGIILIEDGV